MDQNIFAGKSRRQVKIFTADKGSDLEAEVNQFLSDIKGDWIVDVKYASNMPEPGVILYTAMVIYTAYPQESKA